ncbi:D-alanyl-D-alanine carboxypeptidase family protein [Pelagerythrobacter sp.]|uniref:D-alanyl-D-alanine carboxypeptidase family protein n=1 Tax=Pelagerythrobacter sp. TaxID=2800702 RepID=UPI0035AE650B
MLPALALATAAGGADPAPERVERFPGAPIALLVDLSSGQTLFSREPDRRFMPASITKVMTAFVAFELIDAGKLSPGQSYTMSEQAYRDWHAKGSSMFLDRSEPVTVETLLLGITSVSANDGAIVLAEGAAGSVDNWLSLMNAKAREIGMNDSHFGTPNGWMDEGRTFVTAHDLAVLAREMIARHPRLYAFYFGREGMEYRGIAQANHDPITGRVEGADGLKTGFTNQAGYGFLGSAERDGRRLVMVAATAPTPRDRNDAAIAMMEWGFDAFDTRKLYQLGGFVGEALVQEGARTTVPLVAAGPIAATLPKGSRAKPKLTIRYDGPLQAPLKEGERVAELEIAIDGAPPSYVPLVTGQAVAKANDWQRLKNGVAALFR